jgi:hypothetical protein
MTVQKDITLHRQFRHFDFGQIILIMNISNTTFCPFIMSVMHFYHASLSTPHTFLLCFMSRRRSHDDCSAFFPFTQFHVLPYKKSQYMNDAKISNTKPNRGNECKSIIQKISFLTVRIFRQFSNRKTLVVSPISSLVKP